MQTSCGIELCRYHGGRGGGGGVIEAGSYTDIMW